MKTRHYLFLLCCLMTGCFILTSNLYAQSSMLDSLENMLNTQKLTPAEQLNLYQELSSEYLYVQIEKAYSYAKKSIDLAHAMKNENQEARGYSLIGNVYLGKGDYPQALEYYLKALPIYEKFGNMQSVGILFHNIGVIYQFLLNWEQAYKYFLMEEKIVREIGDNEGLAAVLVSLSDLQLRKEEYDMALGNALQAVNLFRKLNNMYGEAMALLTVAKCYYVMDNNDSALEYAQKGLLLSETLQYRALIAKSYTILI